MAYAVAATQTQGVYVSAGDDGTADEVLDTSTMLCTLGTNSTGQIVDEFAANSNVTAVGGTQFKPKYDSSSNNSGFVPEAVWNQSQGAGGGGISALAPQPSYQKGPGVPVGGNRDIPDVSFQAGSDTKASGMLGPGVFIGTENPMGSTNAVLTCCRGGTSLGAPVWAGISRLIEQRSGTLVGNLNPELYALGGLAWAGGLRDVIAGNNGFNGVPPFNATLGYDLATGWGTPDITTFVNAFVFSRGLVASGIKGANTTITSAEIYTPSSTSRTAGTFSSGGTFVDSRINYGVSPLPDGTILVFGGVVGGTAVKTAGIYDPSKGTFTILKDAQGHNILMPEPRETDILATLLFTGKVFIAGRDDTGQYTSTTLYDPVAKSFSAGPSQKAPPAGIHALGYTETLLADGRVLIQGGTAVSQIYDPDPNVNSFCATNAQPKIANRMNASSVLLPDGRVLIAGGDIGITPTATAEVYTPPPSGAGCSNADSYVQTSNNMAEVRITPPLLVINTGKVLVMGSDKLVDLFDPSTNKFSATGQMQVARGAYGFSRLNNGTVLVAGGTNGTNNIASAEIYDPVAGSFTLTGSLSTARNSPFDFAVK